MQVSFIAVNGIIEYVSNPTELLQYRKSPVFEAVYKLRKEGWKPQGKLFSQGAATELTARRPKTYVFVKE